MDLRTAVSMLPTPRARDSKGGALSGDGLVDAVKLLPTPTAGNPNDGESLESWEARRQRNLAKGINGNGQGTPLAIAIKLLPTPAASFPGTTANFRPDGTPYSEGYGMTLLDAVRLLPTPWASDGEKGGPNQRGSKGDLMLPSAVAQLLPTPRASRGGSSTETMYELGAERTDGSRPQGEVLLPTPTAADSERTSSTYGRGNPTLTGAITDPPSNGGKQSSDDEPPGQPTLWDD
jgi:hypothetical protein